uniref:Uncharacterized protein n=1 Tax=Pyxicephalus adspersus TaxID=30357 RepID=A0AAV3B4P8_PYXAD|nr:TPA: hypothetical protein GDO54_001702 [Pyxicephalus adspersus]
MQKYDNRQRFFLKYQCLILHSRVFLSYQMFFLTLFAHLVIPNILYFNNAFTVLFILAPVLKYVPNQIFCFPRPQSLQLFEVIG